MVVVDSQHINSNDFSEEAAMAAAVGRAREQSRAIVGATLANTRISEEQVSLISS
jgi:hypothetical protein